MGKNPLSRQRVPRPLAHGPEPHFLRGYLHEAFYRYKDAVAEHELLRCLKEQPLDVQVRVAWAGYLFAVGRTVPFV